MYKTTEQELNAVKTIFCHLMVEDPEFEETILSGSTITGYIKVNSSELCKKFCYGYNSENTYKYLLISSTPPDVKEAFNYIKSKVKSKYNVDSTYKISFCQALMIPVYEVSVLMGNYITSNEGIKSNLYGTCSIRLNDTTEYWDPVDLEVYEREFAEVFESALSCKKGIAQVRVLNINSFNELESYIYLVKVDKNLVSRLVQYRLVDIATNISKDMADAIAKTINFIKTKFTDIEYFSIIQTNVSRYNQKLYIVEGSDNIRSAYLFVEGKL